MKNPHITFDPSAIIQSRRFGSQTVSGITARELLRPNAFIYQPKSSFTISPYDIGNNSFIPSKNLLYENFQNDNSSSNSTIGIDNYDPRNPTAFTEDLTLAAIKNLGIQSSDLFFPTDAILGKINGDKRYFENLLIERALKYKEEVKKERKRIIETASNVYLNQINNPYSDCKNIINSNSQNYFRREQTQRPSTGVKSLKPTDALEKAKLITEKNDDSKKQDFQYEKNNEKQTQIDIFEEKKKRPYIYPHTREENYIRIEDREYDKRKKESLGYFSRPSSRKRTIRSSMSHNYSLRSSNLSVSEQKNSTFLD
ncbi:hypothetical protein M9Y10_004977 [Tritrichomonas musculus]|uniref:Uncharacterized protein n=1 Tax=Tritrichomonas musculus TaxID=1915356 RepID=A0ABR2JLU3_9EUKA